MTNLGMAKPLVLEKRQRNQRGEGGRLKQELVEAAMRILDREPGIRLSLRMVAKEAGVAAPSVYSHFPDARTMMTEIVTECWAQLGHRMAQAAPDAVAMPPLAELKAKMSAYIHYAMERPSRYQLLFAMSSGVEHDLEAPLRPAYRHVLNSLDRMEAAGKTLPTGDAATTALLTLSLAHGRIALAHLAPGKHGNNAAGVDEFTQHSLDILFGE